MKFFFTPFVMLWLCLGMSINTMAQGNNTGQLKGRVFNDLSDLPASDVAVSIPYLRLLTYSDGEGDFGFSQIPYGTYTVVIGGNAHRTDTMKVVIDKDVVVIGSIKVHVNDASSQASSVQIPSIALQENDVNDGEENSGSAGTSGLLSASRDPFVNTAAYIFGPYRFQPRAYDRNSQQVLINGATMNDIETGDAYWSQWGGLNDVFRNRSNIYGLQPSDVAFGSLLGSVYFDVTAANQRKQTRLTYSLSNRQYRQRFMFTYSSGLLKSGWAYSVSLSRRYAGEGYVPGTYYDGYSYYGSVSKKLGKGILSLTTFGAPTERGKMAPAIQEAYDLADCNYYNPNWGFMNGVKKNAKVQKSYQPISMLNYEYQPSNSFRWTTVLAYQYGKLKNSTLDWFDAYNPRPDYYRNFPSYYLLGDPVDSAQAVRQGEYFKNNSQINWDQLVQSNYINKVARYDAKGNLTGDSARQSLFVIGDDVDDIRKWNFNTNFDFAASEHVTIQGGLSAISQVTESYRELKDLLGGDFYVNRNQFTQVNTLVSGYSIDNDINNPNQEVKVGDKYYYNYRNNFVRINNWIQAVFNYNKVDFFLGGSLGWNTFNRDGLFRNGLFPLDNESYGKSDKMRFLLYGIKGGVTYKFDGRNYIFANALFQSDPPTVDNTFISPRTRNYTVNNPTEQKTFSLEGGYIHRSPKVNARAVGFLTDITDATDIKRFYNESNGANTFTNYVLSGVATRNIGLELALEYKFNSSFSATGVFAHSQAFYTNNPNISIYKDNFIDTTGQGGYAGTEKVYIKNYNLATGFQTASTLGLNYRSKNYWYANLNFNYFANSYVDIAPNRRTEDAVGLLDRGSAEYAAIVNQEKLPSAFTMDLFAGKSFLLSKTFKGLPRNTFLYFNVGINNLLNNKDIRTSGFEQLRFDAAGRVAGRYPSKYFYAYGANYFINISLKF